MVTFKGRNKSSKNSKNRKAETDKDNKQTWNNTFFSSYIFSNDEMTIVMESWICNVYKDYV